MRFKPFTEEEVETDDSLSPGFYFYEVIEVEESVSKAGNNMYTLVLNIENEQGISGKIYDNLVLVDKSRWKIKQFAKSCGLEECLIKGIISKNDIINKKGKCSTKIEKTNNGDFLKIKTYIKSSENNVNLDVEDDDIPF